MIQKGAFNRILPSNIEAEKALLASILASPDAMYEAFSRLLSSDFYQPSHQVIYEAMINLNKIGKAVDLVTLSEKLLKEDKISIAGGIGYVAEISDFISTPSIAENYIEIIKEKSILRQIIWLSNETAAEGFSGKLSAEELLAKAEQGLFNIASYKLQTELTPVSNFADELAHEIEDLHKSKGKNIAGISTGFTKLDMLTSGFQKGDLIIIAGRPGMGKTAFSLNIAQNASLSQSKNVAFFSLEMTKKQLASRIISRIGRVDNYMMRTGRFDDNQWSDITSAIDELSTAKLYIDDTPTLSAMQMAAKCRKAKLKYGLDLVIIDYLQLISMRERERKDLEVSETTRSLKILAKELDVPVVLLSQLNRSLESRDNKRPHLADLRESGAIEQDADVVLFIYRDRVYKQKSESEDEDNTAEIIIGKQRNGPTGTAKLMFIDRYTSFENMQEGGVQDDEGNF